MTPSRRLDPVPALLKPAPSKAAPSVRVVPTLAKPATVQQRQPQRKGNH